MKFFRDNILYMILLFLIVSFSIGIVQWFGVQSQVIRNRELLESNQDLIQSIKQCRGN